MRIPEFAPVPEKPKKGWLERLEETAGGNQIVEIDGIESSIIIKKTNRVRYPDAFNDWTVEIRNPEGSPVVTERYDLKNDRGLVRTTLTGRFLDLPNVAGVSFKDAFYCLPDGSDFMIGIGENKYDPADQVDYNLKAARIVNYIDRVISTAKVVVKTVTLI